MTMYINIWTLHAEVKYVFHFWNWFLSLFKTSSFSLAVLDSSANTDSFTNRFYDISFMDKLHLQLFTEIL